MEQNYHLESFRASTITKRHLAHMDKINGLYTQNVKLLCNNSTLHIHIAECSSAQLKIETLYCTKTSKTLFSNTFKILI